MRDSGYQRAKGAQEKLIRESAIPYSIVHATQFFEFLKSITEAVARISVGQPVNGVFEVGSTNGVGKRLRRARLTRRVRRASGLVQTPH